MKALVPPSGSAPSSLRRVDDAQRHGLLHRTVLASVAGAAAGGFVADLLARLSFLDGRGAFMVLAAAGAFTAVTIFTRWGLVRRSRRRLPLAAGIGAATAAGTTLALSVAQWAPLSAALLGLVAAPILGAGERLRRKALTGVVAGGFAYAGLHVAQALAAAGAFLPLVPGPLASAAAGATAGLFIGLAAAPRHLIPSPDPVEEAYEQALSLDDGEIAHLLDRALSIHRVVRRELHAGPAPDAKAFELEAQVSEQLMRILRIAEHCRQIGEELSEDAAGRLDQRISAMEAKLAEASDGARATYRQAVQSLLDQRSALHQLADGRERVIARLHVNVAILERLRLALLQVESADAERFGEESGALSEALEELGRELDATAAAVSEVFGGRRALPSPR